MARTVLSIEIAALAACEHAHAGCDVAIWFEQAWPEREVLTLVIRIANAAIPESVFQRKTKFVCRVCYS